MKPIEFVVFLGLGAAAISLAHAHSDRWTVRETETIQKTLTLSGAPMRLVVDNVDGYVHVTGISGSEVQVKAQKTIRAETDADLKEAKADVKLDIEERPGNVSVYYDAPWRCNGKAVDAAGSSGTFYSVTYDIDIGVPASARVVISTVNNGDISVEKTAGDFEVRNVNGGIRMSSAGGSGDAVTVNGPVMVRFAKNPAAGCKFKSVNGALDVYFPSDLSADLAFKTLNGQIYSDFEVTSRLMPATSPEQRDGKYVYRSNGMKAARAGAGGPELSFDTLNGNIRLHRGE